MKLLTAWPMLHCHPLFTISLCFRMRFFYCINHTKYSKHSTKPGQTWVSYIHWKQKNCTSMNISYISHHIVMASFSNWQRSLHKRVQWNIYVEINISGLKTTKMINASFGGDVTDKGNYTEIKLHWGLYYIHRPRNFTQRPNFIRSSLNALIMLSERRKTNGRKQNDVKKIMLLKQEYCRAST